MKRHKKPHVPDFLKQALATMSILPSQAPIHPLNKLDESLTPNMRALRLTMAIGSELLAMGVAASDVVHMARGITDTYCKRRVHVDISSTLITVSQDRGIDKEPLTLMRTIALKDANYHMIQDLQQLALLIRNTNLPLEEAEQQLEVIIASPRRHPRWITYGSSGLVSMGAVILFGGSPLMCILAFVMGILATGVLRWLWKIGVSLFYAQIAVALCITLATGFVEWLNVQLGLGINTTLLVISGIILLVAGLLIVGAFQDAIDEFYVTAGARLLRVGMMTGGIVVGVLIGLYIIQRSGISFPTTPDRLTLTEASLQYVGALLIAAGFAAGNHARLFGMIISGLAAMFGWWVSRMLMDEFGIVIASGMAAAAIGVTAVFVSRLSRFPSMAIIAAGIVPLVPGLSLYNGLMGVVANPPGDPEFMMALAVLARAVMIGLVVAMGASVGNVIARPIRRRVIHAYRYRAAKRPHES